MSGNVVEEMSEQDLKEYMGMSDHQGAQASLKSQRHEGTVWL